VEAAFHTIARDIVVKLQDAAGTTSKVRITASPLLVMPVHGSSRTGGEREVRSATVSAVPRSAGMQGGGTTAGRKSILKKFKRIFCSTT
jgi:hypothetical protein